MSISINNMLAAYQSKAAVSKSESRTSGMTSVVPNYDAVTINTSPQKEESRFAGQLAKAISEQVRKPASPQRLEQLSQQIADDTYPVSPQEIAARILMTNGGATN